MIETPMTFDQLVEMVGSASTRTTTLADPLVIRSGLAGFIEPNFLASNSIDDLSKGRVLLIAAPAAVGKSVLARELGLRTRNPLVDLAGRRIGEAFFTGALGRRLGGQQALELIAELHAGRATLIIDSADEALVGNGPQDYGVAINDLADLIGAGGLGRPAAVILGRPDTIDETARVLEQTGTPVSRIDVAFFTEDQARAFVRLKALGSSGSGPAQELQDFLGAFFDLVMDALGARDWFQANSFVGYAPVLDALATFYDPEVNMMRVLNEIKRAGTTEHVWGLLIQIIQKVLDRETEKFAKSFGAGDADKADYGRLSYTRDLQLSLLMADRPLDVPITPEVEPADEAWWVEIETQIREQFRVHPFVAGGLETLDNPLLRFTNAAFRDYVVASTLGETDPIRARVIRDSWCDPAVAPSPILMRLALSKEMGLDAVNSTALTLLVASHAAEFRDDVQLSVEEQTPDQRGMGVLVEARLVEAGIDVHAVTSQFSPGEALYLAQGIARTDLNVPSLRVVAGEGAQEFSVGPLADITCGEFASEAPELRLRPSPDEQPSFIETQRVSGVTRRVAPPSASLLKLIASETAYPWTSFRASRPSDGTVTPQIWAAAGAFQSNARWFIRQSMVKGDPNYPADVMDTILAKGRASRAAHDFGVERNIIAKEDGVYFLHLADFSVRDIVDLNLENVGYRAFVEEFAIWAEQKGISL
ncbi:hypothetical protein [Microbacterium dextranolyticum]|uniref:Uncharacterized protein n=1 Tax=Microbacterium dextranolyticum TaxID=36806 RepID=A0A9W6HL39_9MICO|nr:hypothetical protein [Microbacterium dextranolyticum]MBM7463513.1 hypothetical protein [Microbacterium dextranolyticum]GLJ94615.1 hypothetical protein GCM10017591_06760 [Microbacterium dextranolyticum]